MAEVRLTGVRKVYGRGAKATTVIDALDLTIPDRAFVVLVGPSGCGKSTTLRLIAGLEEATAGDLFIGERRVNEVPPKDRDIAMVFQSYALYPHMTVRQNLGFGLSLRRLPSEEIRQRVDEVAATLGLADLLDRRPAALSGGQRQRVAMGRAIVRRPEVFLFDEPLSNLDAKLRAEMRREIAKLHRRLQTTIVYVTHDQVEAMTLADEIVVMNGGEIQQQGPPLTLFERPANRFVATFIGTPPMNLIEARVGEATGGSLSVAGEDFTWTAPTDWQAEPGQAVQVGVRPSDLRVGGSAGDDAGALEMRGEVVVYEPMGAESTLTVATAAGEVLVRVEGSGEARPGDVVRLVAAADRVHLFAADDGRALRSEENAAS